MRIARRFEPRAEALESRLALAVLLQTNFSEDLVASELSSATTMELSPDGKVFVAEQAGTLEVWQDGVQLQTDFFRDTPLATQTSGERGLLGVTFDPDYATNRFVYVYYTTIAEDGHNRVARFTANETGDLAIAGSQVALVELDPHGDNVHNGGAIHFGSDGKLYVATGDHAIGTNAQQLTNRHGKILRYNPDGTIPADNPRTFDGVEGETSGVNRAIWAIGLRNPFTFSFQPDSGKMYINDVGQSDWEEINEGGAGRNYGWPVTEGDFDPEAFPDFTRPVYAYKHGIAHYEGFAITGGDFYNPSNPGLGVFPSKYQGDYFFADFVMDFINVIDADTQTVSRFATDATGIIDVRVGVDGSLYYLARDASSVYRIYYTANQPPSITQEPHDHTSSVGTAATFSVLVSGSSPLSYQWQRAEAGTSDWSDIPDATGSSYTLPSTSFLDDQDLFRVVVTNTFGSETSAAAKLTVTANQAPTAEISIVSGLVGGRFNAGQGITFSGVGFDSDDGTLEASQFTWRVDYISSIASGNAAIRPFVPEFTGNTSGSFTPAITGPYTLTDVAYRIVLTVTDSLGLSTTVTHDVLPNTATLTLATNPPGLVVTLDGQPFTTPHTFESVVGFERKLGAPTSQAAGGVAYALATWSDGGAASHAIRTPSTSTTYLAPYVLAANAGLKAQYFDLAAPLVRLPNLAKRVADVTRRDATIDYAPTVDAWNGLDARFVDTYAALHTGYVHIATPGAYTFYLGSDEGAKLWLDGRLLVDNDGAHEFREVGGTRWLTAGLHAIRVEYLENGGAAGLVMSWSGPGISKQVVPAGVLSPGVFRQGAGKNGLISLEAENNDGNNGAGGNFWAPNRRTAGFSGAGALQAAPAVGAKNDLNFVTNSPRLDFRVNFARTGVHYVWVRGQRPRGAGGSVHVGLNGGEVATADKIGLFPVRRFGWIRTRIDGSLATINVASTGVHTLNLWMREDGTIVDKVIVTANSRYRPRNRGPIESARL